MEATPTELKLAQARAEFLELLSALERDVPRHAADCEAQRDHMCALEQRAAEFEATAKSLSFPAPKVPVVGALAAAFRRIRGPNGPPLVNFSPSPSSPASPPQTAVGTSKNGGRSASPPWARTGL
jgi:hypothetical protein